MTASLLVVSATLSGYVFMNAIIPSVFCFLFLCFFLFYNYLDSVWDYVCMMLCTS